MTESSNLTIDSDTDSEVTLGGYNNIRNFLRRLSSRISGYFAGSAATANQHNLAIISTRNWFLYLPPEIRLIIYHHVLLLPHDVNYDFPMVWRHPEVQAVTGILRTSRLIRGEAIDVFLRENTFVFLPWLMSLPIMASIPQSNDRIQNFTVDILLCPPWYQSLHPFFTAIMRHLGDTTIIRGTLSVHFTIDLDDDVHGAHFRSYLRGLGRFTNFQVVEIDFVDPMRRAQSTAMHCDFLHNALRFVLGPAKPYTEGEGLIFYPQRFMNAQPPRENVDWIDLLDGIRLDWDRDETNR